MSIGELARPLSRSTISVRPLSFIEVAATHSIPASHIAAMSAAVPGIRSGSKTCTHRRPSTSECRWSGIPDAGAAMARTATIAASRSANQGASARRRASGCNPPMSISSSRRPGRVHTPSGLYPRAAPLMCMISSATP